MTNMQTQAQNAIDTLVESGDETGIQVAVYQDGQLVVDAVAGRADPASDRPVTSDTPFYSASTGKGVTATVVHVLVERGLFGYDTPIVELWPEFGAHGKDRATVRHALTHAVGVPGLPADTTPEDLTDWEHMCRVIAAAEPWWEPGTACGYHPQTFGYILGEVVRRATGRPISQVLRDEVAGPLGIADELFLGVPPSELGRAARLEDAVDPVAFLAMMPPDFPLFRASPPAVTPSAAFANRPDILMADIPAGGTFSARAIARMYAALLGEIDGLQLVSPERLREISTLATSGTDQVTMGPATWALGYAVGRPGPREMETPTVFGMVGMGGSAAWADTATGTAFALTKNRFNPTANSAAQQLSELVAQAVAER